MNSDYNFKPVPPTQPNQPAQQDFDTSHLPQPHPEYQPPKKKGVGFFRKLLTFLLLLVLLAAVGAGIYLWQQAQVKSVQDAKTRLERQVSGLQTQIKNQATDTPAVTTLPATIIETKVVTGQASAIAATSATADILYLPGEVTAAWIEVGLKPAGLTPSGDKVTQGLGTGVAGQYAKQPVQLKTLTAGTTYFYRAAATVDGKTVYGGVASFTTAK